jgi:hypothetical protein
MKGYEQRFKHLDRSLLVNEKLLISLLTQGWVLVFQVDQSEVFLPDSV